jgi:hypothetical protein
MAATAEGLSSQADHLLSTVSSFTIVGEEDQMMIANSRAVQSRRLVSAAPVQGSSGNGLKKSQGRLGVALERPVSDIPVPRRV